MPISYRQAYKIVLKTVKPFASQRQPLEECTGLFLADDVRADRDLPAADQSAMDGYAVCCDDLADAPVTLRLIGEVAAGSPARPTVSRGTCARILTGGNVPPGADSVIMVEKTREAGEGITFLEPVAKGANIRRKGEVARRRDVVLAAGTQLDRLQAAVCSAFGKSSLKVRRRAKVAVVVTGREVLSALDRVKAHQLRDSNGPAIGAALVACGYVNVPVKIATDDPKKLKRILERAVKTADVVVVTGGVSVGKYDYVPGIVREIGAKVRYHGVVMKPGKPQLYATLGRNKHIFGLPGNPLSVMTGLHEFVLPALRRMSGCPEEDCRPKLMIPLAGPAKSRTKRTGLILARLVQEDGVTAALPIKSMGSADIVAAGGADGVVIIPADAADLPAGAVVEFRPWRALW